MARININQTINPDQQHLIDNLFVHYNQDRFLFLLFGCEKKLYLSDIRYMLYDLGIHITNTNVAYINQVLHKYKVRLINDCKPERVKKDKPICKHISPIGYQLQQRLFNHSLYRGD